VWKKIEADILERKGAYEESYQGNNAGAGGDREKRRV